MSKDTPIDVADRLTNAEGKYGKFLDDAYELLPTWFVPRMMDDVWSFGLLLTTGHVLAVQQLTDVRKAGDGSIWLDVTLCERPPYGAEKWPLKCLVAPTSRLSASVAASQVVCAVELADT
jgi:hypothetical protein